jgi:hypothetical protein
MGWLKIIPLTPDLSRSEITGTVTYDYCLEMTYEQNGDDLRFMAFLLCNNERVTSFVYYFKYRVLGHGGHNYKKNINEFIVSTERDYAFTEDTRKRKFVDGLFPELPPESFPDNVYVVHPDKFGKWSMIIEMTRNELDLVNVDYDTKIQKIREESESRIQEIEADRSTFLDVLTKLEFGNVLK